jgi:tetratricopeptide (TPR) repeat protein
MPSDNRWVAPLAFCLSLPVYLITLAPTVSGEDSGELVTAAWSLGIAHPPGYPLWCMLGKLCTLVVPAANVAYRVNLLSAVVASLATAVVAVLVGRFLSLRGTRAPILALSAALLFAFSRDFWAQSVIAEVYSLNILFFAIVLLMVFLWEDTGKPRYLYLLAFTYGLSLTHHTTMIPLGALIGLYVLWRTPRLLKRPLILVNLLGAVLAGFSLVLYLPIRSLADPAMDWGNPETLSAALGHIRRRQYTGMEGVRPRVLAEQIVLVGHFLENLAMQFTPVLAWIIPLGAWRHLRLERRSFLLLAGLFIACSYGFIWLLNYPPVREDLVIKRTFYLPAYAVATVWLALGLAEVQAALSRLRATSRLPRPGPALARLGAAVPLAAAALPLLWFYSENDKSDYHYAEDYGKNLLRSLEENAIVVPSSDHTTFPLIYLTAVEKLRPDVLIADKYGDIDDESLKDLFEADRAIKAPPPVGAGRDEKILYLAEHSRRPVFVTIKERLPPSRFRVLRRGLLFKVCASAKGPEAGDLESLWKSYEWHAGTFTKGNRDYTADMILADYYQARGDHCFSLGKKQEAVADIQLAAKHGSGIKEVLNNLGGCLAENDYPLEAIPLLLEAWEVEPGYAFARRNLALAYQQAENYAEGFTWFELQLAETPEDPSLLRAAARGAKAIGNHFDALKHYFHLARLCGDDPELLREISEFLRKIGASVELVKIYEEKGKKAEEARKLEEEQEPDSLEEGKGLPKLPELPGVALPGLPETEPRIPGIDMLPGGSQIPQPLERGARASGKAR